MTTTVNSIYKHAIYVNISGHATKPVVSLWCADCLVTVEEFGQNNKWDFVQDSVNKHCSQMSKRESYQREKKENS
jgi:hypothetical protein